MQNRLATIDWKLLVFLLLFLNVKLLIKIAAIILVYAVRPDFKFGFKVKNSRLPLFYPIVISIAIFNWTISGLLTNTSYSLAVLTGILFWLLCILTIHQVKLSVEKNDPSVIHRTIIAFFIINALASLATYGSIVWETGAINPYRYQGNFQKYFIGTGDYIKGVTLDTSTTNAVINAFAVVYFLIRNKYVLALLSITVLLLTGSNTTNLLLCFTLLYLFIFQSNKDQKSIIVACLVFLAVFLAKVSPQNNTYIATAFENIFGIETTTGKTMPATEKPDSLLTREEKQRKYARYYLDSIQLAVIKKYKDSIGVNNTVAVVKAEQKFVIPQPSIHSAPFQHKNDTTAFQEKLIAFIKVDNLQQQVSTVKQYHLPGKLIALLQAFTYLKLHPYKILTGAGAGMFSSKLAFKISALKIAGGYPAQYAFINEDFKNNNLALYLNYFTRPAESHSLLNTPNSTYTQILSEYGLAGLGSFLIFYLGFFCRNLKKLTYGIPVLFLMSGLFFMEYWFEQLSVVVLFELLLFLNIKEQRREEQNS